MSRASKSSENFLTSLEDEDETNKNQAIETDSCQPEQFKKTQEYKELLSETGSTSSTGGSYTTTPSTSSSEDEADHEYENQDDDDNDPDMKLIMSALEKSSDNSGMKLGNKTFNDQQVRDIERTNSILMNRILSHNRRTNKFTPAPKNSKVSSSALNRQKQQRQIDHDNLILLKKIQTVKPFVVNHQKR